MKFLDYIQRYYFQNIGKMLKLMLKMFHVYWLIFDLVIFQEIKSLWGHRKNQMPAIPWETRRIEFLDSLLGESRDDVASRLLNLRNTWFMLSFIDVILILMLIKTGAISSILYLILTLTIQVMFCSYCTGQVKIRYNLNHREFLYFFLKKKKFKEWFFPILDVEEEADRLKAIQYPTTEKQ